MGSLLPTTGVQPKYSQLYFFDTHNETTNRMSAFIRDHTAEGPEESIVRSLIDMTNEFSSVGRAFRMAIDWCVQNNSYDFQLRLLGHRTPSRQYNAPIVSEVVVLITNDFGDANEERDIIVNNKNCGLQRIS